MIIAEKSLKNFSGSQTALENTEGRRKQKYAEGVSYSTFSTAGPESFSLTNQETA